MRRQPFDFAIFGVVCVLHVISALSASECLTCVMILKAGHKTAKTGSRKMKRETKNRRLKVSITVFVFFFPPLPLSVGDTFHLVPIIDPYTFHLYQS